MGLSPNDRFGVLRILNLVSAVKHSFIATFDRFLHIHNSHGSIVRTNSRLFLSYIDLLCIFNHLILVKVIGVVHVLLALGKLFDRFLDKVGGWAVLRSR